MKMRLGGQDVLVWKPDSIIDDQSLQELDWNKASKVCKRRLGTWNTVRLAASSPNQNWKI